MESNVSVPVLISSSGSPPSGENGSQIIRPTPRRPKEGSPVTSSSSPDNATVSNSKAGYDKLSELSVGKVQRRVSNTSSVHSGFSSLNKKHSTSSADQVRNDLVKKFCR